MKATPYLSPRPVNVRHESRGKSGRTLRKATTRNAYLHQATVCTTSAVHTSRCPRTLCLHSRQTQSHRTSVRWSVTGSSLFRVGNASVPLRHCHSRPSLCSVGAISPPRPARALSHRRSGGQGRQILLPPEGLVLDGREHGGTLERVGGPASHAIASHILPPLQPWAAPALPTQNSGEPDLAWLDIAHRKA